LAKHLIDVDESALSAAWAELGTETISDTVNTAMRLATHERARRVRESLATLAAAQLDDREDAWR